MRLGFKNFNVGKREYCIYAYRHTDRDWRVFHFLPAIELQLRPWAWELEISFLFWSVRLEDETNQNMSCFKG